VILLDGANGKLDGVVSVAREDWRITYDFRGIHSSPHDLQPDFGVLLDDLEILA